MHCQQWQQKLRYLHRLASTDPDRLLHAAMSTQQTLNDAGKKCWLTQTVDWVNTVMPGATTLEGTLDSPVDHLVQCAKNNT